MNAPAFDALAAAKAAGVRIILQGDGLILEARPKLPPDVVAQLKAVKSDVLRILAGGRRPKRHTTPIRRRIVRRSGGPKP